MPISVSCPGCGHDYTVQDSAAGRKFRCKHCETVVQVPAGPSDNPYADLDGGEDFEEDFGDDAPAAPSRSGGGRRRRRRNAGGGEAAVAPGISLLIVGALSLIGFITWGIFNLTQLEQIPAAQRNQPGFMLGYNFTFYHFPLDLIVMAGGFAMLQRKWYGLAMTGAVLSVIPCCSPCGLLGLPFGIWALVVLMNDDVKAAF